ncbi:DUF2461 domain-containing protein [Larkinella terrae]|uniref:TIGR02453 family protein n=1 Tax=Larkinella terrae TaxID=2025311 RepID=A0A7K0EMV3_9BACT|nr:DUF2461 domain-containing protein [Larkinella terrae]MRS62871.1 TIGR02453 family protein [Larkinella terrae]
MLKPETIRFLSSLRSNNNKQWFDQNRPAYEAARADFLSLVERTLVGLEQTDREIAASQLQPKSCVFRINRDVRFSTDKSPYKTNFGAWFNAGGKNSRSAGYYLNVEPGNAFVAGGMYMPDTDVLAAIRQEIDYNLPAFESILTQPAFRSYFSGLNRETALQRPPKGYDVNNPGIEYLKLKSFTVSHSIPDSMLTTPGLSTTVQAAFASLQPLVKYLNRSLPQSD